MKFYLLILIIMQSLNCNFKVNDPIFIYEENPIINIDENNNKAHYILTINSKNKKFNLDSFKFVIQTKQTGFNTFEELNSVKRTISIDSIKLNKKTDFMNEKPWKLHELFSLNKNINLVLNSENKYFYYPLKYKGTEKNIELLAR